MLGGPVGPQSIVAEVDSGHVLTKLDDILE